MLSRLHGKWVKFPAAKDAFPGAHRAKDGKVVGIYQEAHTDPVVPEAGDPVEVPARIMVVDPSGYNMVTTVKGEVVTVSVPPASVKFEPITNHLADCPHERVKHLAKPTGV